MFSPASTGRTWTPALPAANTDAGRETGGEQTGLALGPHAVPQGSGTCAWDDPRGGQGLPKYVEALNKRRAVFPQAAGCGISGEGDRAGRAGDAGPRAAGRGSSRCAAGGRVAAAAAPRSSAPRGFRNPSSAAPGAARTVPSARRSYQSRSKPKRGRLSLARVRAEPSHPPWVLIAGVWGAAAGPPPAGGSSCCAPCKVVASSAPVGSQRRDRPARFAPGLPQRDGHGLATSCTSTGPRDLCGLLRVSE